MSTTDLLREDPLRHLDKLNYVPPDVDPHDTRQDVLLFQIPGNPGIISYYQPFIDRLHGLLCESESARTSRFYAYGFSLANFETQRHQRKPKESPSSLQEQIEYTEDRIYGQIDFHLKAEEEIEQLPKVILIGHSVGAYILLEIIRRHEGQARRRDIDFDLIGGILLFPTITHIAKSPLGRISDRVVRIPHLALMVGAWVKFWTALLPETFLLQLIRLFGRFPKHAARNTARFIKSPMGVRQAIHLGKDEMHTITGDKWDEKVWGAATSPGTDRFDTAQRNLFFYWGKKDEWVADHTREDLMSAHSQSYTKDAPWAPDNSRPFMVVDQKGIPHGFVIKHSEVVADIVCEWVEKIVNAHAHQTSTHSSHPDGRDTKHTEGT